MEELNYLRRVAKEFFEATKQLPDVEAPTTRLLAFTISIIFIGELAITYYYGMSDVRSFVRRYFFINQGLAWALSPLLHKGVFHWLANVLGVIYVGHAVERHWSRWRFIGFLLIAGYVGSGLGWFFRWSFTSQPVFVYGTSGIVFALAGFSLVHLPTRHLYVPGVFERISKLEWLAVITGALVVLTVALDPLTGPYLHPDWINGAHLGGLLIGVIAGRLGWTNCDVDY